MQPYLTDSSGSIDFAAGHRSLSRNRWLPFALVALGTASNLVYAHTPLVAFAAMSGVVLNRRRAIAMGHGALLWQHLSQLRLSHD